MQLTSKEGLQAPPACARISFSCAESGWIEDAWSVAASLRSAERMALRSAFVKSAPITWVNWRFAPARFAPVRFAVGAKFAV